MTDTLTTPASPNFEKLKSKLAELFELDKADLDFGIYRVLRQRHAEISEFLDKHLAKAVSDALASEGNAQLKNDLAKTIEAVKQLDEDPDKNQKVIALKEKLKAGGDLDALADEVYSHLLTFFSRYYQDGDFLGLQRSTVRGREKYMIPYNGEEQKLVWANMDQYYIKSSDLLRDYTFHHYSDPEGLFKGDPGETHTIQFALVEGDTEKENRIAEAKTTRAFSLDEAAAFELIAPQRLRIRFRYREHKSERNLQDKLNVESSRTLADNLPEPWRSILFSVDPSFQAKDKKDTRTILQKHLRTYTAPYQFDYFIHKDLGGFLHRELDFYLKNEVMHLDDIEVGTAPKAEEYLSKLRAIRRCAMPVIRMLTQLEEFQKKLWLKKKFVVETRYCMTLDRVPEGLYEEVCANDLQWEEWEQLYSLSDLPEDLLANPIKTIEFLKANKYLMLDTKHFSDEFKISLLTSFNDLETQFNGIMIQADNFQGTELLMERYKDTIDTIYNDPPYNTDASAILYKNGYRNSSWCSMISELNKRCKVLLNNSGIICTTIDDKQIVELTTILKSLFGDDNLIGTVAVRSNPSGRITLRGVAQCHEYALFCSKSEAGKLTKIPRTEEQQARFDQVDSTGPFEWRNFRRDGSSSTRADRPKQFFPIFVTDKSFKIPALEWDDAEKAYRIHEELGGQEEILWPIDSLGNERCWRWGIDTTRENIQELAVKRNPQGIIQIYNKYRPNQEGILPLTIWTDKKYSSTEYGTAVVKSIFGLRSPFDFPKSIFAVEDCLHISSIGKSGLALDCFAGSGTTGHALLNLNRKDGGNRKYILMEMGAHFDTVLVPRIKKVVYSPDWKEGKPQSRTNGISHAFKIIRLESYEDTLNNLHLNQSAQQKSVLAQATDIQRSEYMLGYFLNVESSGSPGMLDISKFRNPFDYKLQIANNSVGETRATTVDLVETFNWLLGLKVKHVDHLKDFLTVTGDRQQGGRVLVVWRTLSEDVAADNKGLETFLEKIKINPADTEFDAIYINGSHTISDPHNKVHLIEEDFQRRMFETESLESLAQ